VQWYLEVLKKYASFDGRAHRTEFWMFTLVNIIVGMILSILDVSIGTSGDFGGLLSGIYGLAVLVPSIAVGARRLHDIGRSGWWLLIALIPLIGSIILIVWWATAGKSSPNEWGPNPWDGPQPV
jgi:uncharacterized membrane protein YhaH (DUF805 family)